MTTIVWLNRHGPPNIIFFVEIAKRIVKLEYCEYSIWMDTHYVAAERKKKAAER